MHTLYFYFCILYSMLTTKSLVSIRHHTVDLLTHFSFPHQHTFPSGIYYSFLCIYIFVWLGLFIYFVFCSFGAATVEDSMKISQKN